MTDCSATYQTMARSQIDQPEVLSSASRASNGYGVVSGCNVIQRAAGANMSVDVGAGTVLINNKLTAVAGGNVAIDASDATLYRMDILYVNASGTLTISKGSNAAIAPSGETDFKKMYSPYPASLAATEGVILAVIYVEAAATAIHTADIWMNAAKIRYPGVKCVEPVSITHDGGASQTIYATTDLFDVQKVVVKCTEATDTSTIEIGWAGNTDILMTDAEVPKTLNGVKVNRYPCDEQTSAKTIIATVGGAGTIGAWTVWIVLSEFV